MRRWLVSKGAVVVVGREKGLEMREVMLVIQRAVTMHVRLVPLQIKSSTV